MSFIPDLTSIDFKSIYVTDDAASLQPSRYEAAINKFIENFGNEGNDLQIYSAPGRTEIGGNHTDHQHGQVIAASINRDAIGIVRPSDNNIIRVISGDYPMITIDITDNEPKESEYGTTLALIKGVVSDLKNRGYNIGGFDAYVTSDVLIGAGLSSSAAFEVLIGTIISGLYNNGEIDAITIAIASQVAENKYFGKPCGLMDQMACSVGNLVYIDFMDTAKPEVKKVEFDMDSKGYCLCITNTHGSHSNLTDEYAAIPTEMKSVAKELGQEVLRTVPTQDILTNIASLREKCGDRAVIRALHFQEETIRAKKEADALSNGDFEEFLQLVKESGNSSFKYLQNVYVSKDTAHQNVSVALCVSDMVLGRDEASRVHGGGFAGTIQAFVKVENAAKYKEAMDSLFGADSCDIMSIRNNGGIRVI